MSMPPDPSLAEILSLRPLGLALEPGWDPDALPLAGGPLHFSACEATLRSGRRITARRALPLTGLAAWADARGQGEAAKALLTALRAPRPPWAGRDLTRPQVMGIINVTPDSFSDGGDRLDGARAVADGLAMLEAGADILDIGGESTRPGAEPVSIAEEIGRVAPVIEELAAAGACVSVDTRHAEVMAAALAAGASIVNDVTALTDSPQALALAADAQAPVVLMHMQGEPRSMQKAPRYEEVALDIFEYLRGRIAACEAAGLARDKIAVDVGIGFGKTITHNLQLLDRLALFHGLGCPLLLGTSRKSFIGRLSRGEAPKDRLPGSLATVLAGAARGVQIFRVHDVAETKQALAVWQAIADAGAPGGEAG